MCSSYLPPICIRGRIGQSLAVSPGLITNIMLNLCLIVIKVADGIINLGQGDTLTVGNFFRVFARLEKQNDVTNAGTCTFNNGFSAIDGGIANDIRVGCTFNCHDLGSFLYLLLLPRSVVLSGLGRQLCHSEILRSTHYLPPQEANKRKKSFWGPYTLSPRQRSPDPGRRDCVPSALPFYFSPSDKSCK